MLNLKRMLLTTFLISVVSCSSKAPKLEGPLNRAIPTFAKDAEGKAQVMTWRWDEYFTQKKWTTTNSEARAVVPICVDLETYNRTEKYAKQLAKYVEFLEKQNAKVGTHENEVCR